MIVALRRALAGLALGLVVVFGATGTVHAETPSPTPGATATATATASAVDSSDGDLADTPDSTGDNSRQAYALGAAGVLAVLAAAVVFLRRH